ncbi:HlyD family secretion protein [Marinobacter bohaiensis]|uniref:HlyD family secretion protein n=1 Tax=Marinobacter bohaiensis TaxID=2201898 RepID=UPI000DAC1A73|nr:HlyD family secretion protein [Marinobacter bohaiensis]
MSNTDQASEPAPQPARTSKIRRVLLIGIPLTAVVVGGLISLFGGRYVSTENAYIGSPLVNIAPQVSGPITRVLVDDNEAVSQGDLMLQIDPAPYRIEVARAEAQLRQAANAINSLKASYATAQEQLAKTEEDVDFAKRELARQQALAKRNLASQSELSQYQHDYTSAVRQRDANKRELKRIAASLGGDLNLPVEQYPDYQAAAASLEQARLDLAHTRITAPFDGIAANTPDPGAYATVSSPLMSLVGNGDLWIDANFKETALTRVHPGQSVNIEVDTYPDREFHGHVASIAQATGAEFSVLPAQNATGNWVKVVQRIPVRIRFDDAGPDDGLRAGMSTVVDIDTGYPTSDLPLVGWLRGLVGEANAAESPTE